MSPPGLLDALVNLPPRDRQVVTRVALEGLGVTALAELYGVDEAAAAQLAWRAFQGLPGAREQPLEAFLLTWRSGAGAGPLPALRAEREAALARLQAAEQAFSASGWRRVEDVLRWVAIAAIVGLAIWSWRTP